MPEDYKTGIYGDIEVKVDKVVPRHGYAMRHLTLKVRITLLSNILI